MNEEGKQIIKESFGEDFLNILRDNCNELQIEEVAVKLANWNSHLLHIKTNFNLKETIIDTIKDS